jgi:RNA polymerase sigma-70 factor (ECF subfamily)
MDGGGGGQDEQYALAVARFGPALARLARGYEADPHEWRDLLQEIHVALWRSFSGFDARCSLRSWVYRVAHNVGASHVLRGKRRGAIPLATLDEIAEAPDSDNPEQTTGDRHALAQLMTLIHGLRPPDAQLMLLYLEDLDAASIAEITSLSPGAVATRIHRIKSILARKFQTGASDGA